MEGKDKGEKSEEKKDVINKNKSGNLSNVYKLCILL